MEASENVWMAIVKKVENSKTYTLFFGWGVIRPNFILDVKADN